MAVTRCWWSFCGQVAGMYRRHYRFSGSTPPPKSRFTPCLFLHEFSGKLFCQIYHTAESYLKRQSHEIFCLFFINHTDLGPDQQTKTVSRKNSYPRRYSTSKSHESAVAVSLTLLRLFRKTPLGLWSRIQVRNVKVLQDPDTDFNRIWAFTLNQIWYRFWTWIRT